ncbi:MAG: hypothetical protein ACE5GO_04340, partial [Anaerolineales bacterium]
TPHTPISGSLPASSQRAYVFRGASMTYSDFSLRDVTRQFNLTEKITTLFRDLEPLQASTWLKQALDVGLRLALSSVSEKARSEFIVVPILFDLRMRNEHRFAIYSGERLDVDEEKGLKGECDFLLTKGDVSYTIQSPIFSLVEAKKNNIGTGLGQCAAQMVGARLFNQKEGNETDTIFGCVTTGVDWQFLKLQDEAIFIDRSYYHIKEIENILSILQNIINFYITP